jgi:hypothetical protein
VYLLPPGENSGGGFINMTELNPTLLSCMKAAKSLYGRDAFLLSAKSSKAYILDTFQGEDSYNLRKTADALSIILDRIHKYPQLTAIIKRMPAKVNLLAFCDAADEIFDNSALSREYIRDALRYIIAASGGTAEIPADSPPRKEKSSAGIIAVCMSCAFSLCVIIAAVIILQSYGKNDLPYAELTTPTELTTTAESTTTTEFTETTPTTTTTGLTTTTEFTETTPITTTAELTTTTELTEAIPPTETIPAVDSAAEETIAAETYPPRSTTPHDDAETQYPELTDVMLALGENDEFTLLTPNTEATDYLGIIAAQDGIFFGGLTYDEANGTFHGEYLGVQMLLTEDSFYYYVGECAYSSELDRTVPDGYGAMYDFYEEIFIYGRWSNGVCTEEFTHPYQFPSDYIVQISGEGILFSNADQQKFAVIYFDYLLAWVSTDVTVKWFMGDEETTYAIESIDATKQAIFDPTGQPVSLSEGIDFSMIQ